MTMLVPKFFGEDLFDEFMDDFPFGAMPRVRVPHHNIYGKHGKHMMKTDVKETEKSYVLDVDLPGFKKEDVKAELNDGYLTVSATRSFEKENKGEDGKYIRRERFSGDCSRTFYVGDSVKPEDVKAKFENGILTVELPKAEEKELPPKNNAIAIEG